MPGITCEVMCHLFEEEEHVARTATSRQHRAKKGSTRRWSASVNTDATHPPQGLFNKSAAVIARTLVSKKVSPKGPASGMRMLSFYINRGGKNLSASRKAELNKAKKLLSERVAHAKQKKAA